MLLEALDKLLVRQDDKSRNATSSVECKLQIQGQ